MDYVWSFQFLVSLRIDNYIGVSFRRLLYYLNQTSIRKTTTYLHVWNMEMSWSHAQKRILGNHGYLSIHDLFKDNRGGLLRVSPRLLKKIHRAFWLEIIYRGAHLVKWKRVCCDKNFKGLGIRKLDTLNCVFLGKWIWRFSEQWDSLYRRVNS